MKDPIKLREAWLNKVAQRLAPLFKKHGHPLPTNVRATCGFPSTGRKSKRIGECWSSACSNDKHFEIFIHPSESDSLQVAAILAHELDHAAVGLDQKHGGNFKKLALALGLTGKMKSTVPGPQFEEWFKPVLDSLGPYPHATLNTSTGISSRGPKQLTRLLKAYCGDCGYVVRVTQKWIDEAGAPLCPCNKQPMEL